MTPNEMVQKILRLFLTVCAFNGFVIFLSFLPVPFVKHERTLNAIQNFSKNMILFSVLFQLVLAIAGIVCFVIGLI